MSELRVPNTPGPGNTDNLFTVINATTIEYRNPVNGALTRYQDVTDIEYPDGTHKTPTQILVDAGGATYTTSELKACVKVEAFDPDNNNRQLFSVYSSNSKQTAKNVSASVPGGVWVEVFDFLGSGDDNPALQLWVNASNHQYSTRWLGFKVNWGTYAKWAYTMTYVNDFLEESVPCPPSAIDVTMMHDVRLEGLFTTPQTVGGAQYVPIRQFKLYRSAFTSQGSFVYQRVPVDPISVQYQSNFPVQVAGATFPHSVYVAYGLLYTTFGYQFTDNVLTDKLLETLPSVDWDAPPSRTLKGLTAWRNGMMAAYADNLLYLFEPYRPFTAPQKYIKALPYNILGIRIDENALLAVTEGEPFMFTGSHPSNVTYERLQGVQAALKPQAVSTFINPTRALCRTPAGVVYASREGPMLVNGGRGVPLWRDLFTRDEWVNRYGLYFQFMRFAYFDGRLLCYFDGQGVQGFLIGLADGQMTEISADSSLVSDFVLQVTDSMYVVNYASGVSTISRYGDETQARKACLFWTRDVIVPRPVNFGCLQCVGTGNVIAQVYADGLPIGQPLVFTLPGTPNQETHRLPAGFKARRWSVWFTLDPNATLSEAYLAETRLELMSV